MCGRFYLDVQHDELMSHFGFTSIPDLVPRYNIAPSQDIAAVLVDDHRRELKMLHWGLIPFWAKDKKIGTRTINARAETADTKPSFRAAFKYRRCLIPASGFFEWKTEKGVKQFFCIHPKKAPLFAFAGLYEHWDNKAGETIDSCTILVTDANKVIRPVHDRMPVILSPVNYASWLDPDSNDPSMIKPLLRTAPEEDVELYPVSRRVSTPRNDDPECIAPID